MHARRSGEVKILLDECVDRRLARDLVGHSVSTVPRRGWAGIKNGELLALAETEFDLFITVDRKISMEQAGPRHGRNIDDGRRVKIANASSALNTQLSTINCYWHDHPLSVGR